MLAQVERQGSYLQPIPDEQVLHSLNRCAVYTSAGSAAEVIQNVRPVLRDDDAVSRGHFVALRAEITLGTVADKEGSFWQSNLETVFRPTNRDEAMPVLLHQLLAKYSLHDRFVGR